MSWTYQFPTVKDADELRAHEPQLDLPFDVDEAAVRDHLEAVKDAVAVLIESPAFGDCAVQVSASGSALPKHKPWAGKVERRTIEKYGEELEAFKPIESAALEGINISVTQVPPETFEPEVVNGGTT